jgi:O-antigen/teichoic acid export membrane protein
MSATSIASRTAWSFVASIFSACGRLVAGIVIARQLGPALVGQFAFYSAIVEFVGLVAAYGLPNTLTRYVAESCGLQRDESEHEIVVWVSKRFFASLLGATACLAIFFASFSPYGVKTAFLLSILLLTQAMSNLVTAYWTGKQDFKKVAKFSFLSTTALFLFQPLMVYFLGLDGALLGLTLSFIIYLKWSLPLLRGWVERREVTVQRSVLEHARYAWLAAIVSALVWSRAEVFFLSHFSDSRQTGYFTIGLTFASLVTITAGLLTGALMSHFSENTAADNRTELERSYRRMTIFVSICVFPMSIGGVVVMPQLLPFIFGSQYSEAVTVAQVLMIGGLLSFAGVGSSLIYAAGRAKFIFQSGLLGASLVLVGCLLVSRVYGATGVASIRLTVQVLMIGLGTVFIHTQLKFVPPYAAMARIATAASLSAFAAWVIIQCNLPFSLFLAISSAVVAYPFCLKMLRPLTRDDADALMRTVEFLPPLLRKQLSWLVG